MCSGVWLFTCPSPPCPGGAHVRTIIFLALPTMFDINVDSNFLGMCSPTSIEIAASAGCHVMGEARSTPPLHRPPDTSHWDVFTLPSYPRKLSFILCFPEWFYCRISSKFFWNIIRRRYTVVHDFYRKNCSKKFR